MTRAGLFDYLRDLPYGRNALRSDFSLVLKEGQGTCSSKHAFAKSVAIENGWDDIELILCIYKMDESNTSGIGSILKDHRLAYLPEAHCYLRINDKEIDITNSQSDLGKLENVIIERQFINPEQVVDYKNDYHQAFLKNWIENEKIGYSLDKIWSIREKCIKLLSA